MAGPPPGRRALPEEVPEAAIAPEALSPLNGWLVRRHPSPSRRVNSVWPNAWSGEAALAENIAQVESLYSAWGKPARYQICPAALPSELDDVLGARGYAVEAPTSVQIAGTAAVFAATGQRPTPEQSFSVGRQEEIDLEWAAAYCHVQEAAAGGAANRLKALQRIQKQAIYVRVDLDAAPAAIGRGVAEAGWLGIFGMSTHPRCRRLGLATTVLRELAAWAMKRGIDQLYLQVMHDNEGALRLYSNLGFRTLYDYHYRTLVFD